MLNQAVHIIKSGGVIIYPTETLYALGCDARNPLAVDRIFASKNRPMSKPLPVIVGSWEQFLRAVEPDEDVLHIVQSFWPGPLSVLVKIKGPLSHRVRDDAGWTSVRFTPHPTARELCRLSGVPLVATSANPSGMPASARAAELDAQLCGSVDLVVDTPPFPGGGLPSTLIRVLSENTVQVLRPGAVSISDFHGQGIDVVPLSVSGIGLH